MDSLRKVPAVLVAEVLANGLQRVEQAARHTLVVAHSVLQREAPASSLMGNKVGMKKVEEDGRDGSPCFW